MDEVARLVPGADRLDRAGVRRGREDVRRVWLSATQARACSGLSRETSHVSCVSYGRSTPKRFFAIAANWSQ